MELTLIRTNRAPIFVSSAQPIDVLADYEIKPASGINPFLEHPRGYGDDGWFEVYVTANGDQGQTSF